MKLLIKNGTLIDPVCGLGGIMDILIKDGTITVIGLRWSTPQAFTSVPD